MTFYSTEFCEFCRNSKIYRKIYRKKTILQNLQKNLQKENNFTILQKETLEFLQKTSRILQEIPEKL